MAWQGLRLQVPGDWFMVAESGGVERGSLRLADSKMLRLDIKWEKAKKVSLPLSMDGLIKTLGRKVKGFRPLERGAGKVSTHKCFYAHYISAENEGYIYIWFCDGSKRVFILNLMLKPEEVWDFKLKMRKVMESFECHIAEEWVPWSFQGISFQTPISYVLTSRSFKVGLTHIGFTYKDSKILIDYQGFANILLTEKYKDLKDFLKKDYYKNLRKMFKGIKPKSIGKSTISEHEALLIVFEKKISSFPRKLMLIVTSRLWTCEEKNRVYALTFSRLKTGKEEADRKFEEIEEKTLSTFKCH